VERRGAENAAEWAENGAENEAESAENLREWSRAVSGCQKLTRWSGNEGIFLPLKIFSTVKQLIVHSLNHTLAR